MLLGDRQVVEYLKHALNDLYRWIGSIWVLRDPHLEESTTLHLKEQVLDMFLLEELAHFLDHLESIKSLPLGFDGLDIEEACLMHPLHEVDCHGLSLLLEVFVAFKSLFALVAREL